MRPHADTARTGANPLPAPPAEASTVDLDTEELAELRAVVTAYCQIAGLPAERRHWLVTAADEVAGNAVRHGVPPVRARVWADNGAAVEITDHGNWTPDPQLSHLPPPPGTGLGLWAVRLLVDDLDIATGPTGTRVRLHVRQPDHDHPPLDASSMPNPPRSVLPSRPELGPARHLESLRVELRMTVPLAAVSLVQPPVGEPTLRLAYRHRSAEIRFDVGAGLYRHCSTGEELGSPDRVSSAARTVADLLGATPVR